GEHEEDKAEHGGHLRERRRDDRGRDETASLRGLITRPRVAEQRLADDADEPGHHDRDGPEGEAETGGPRPPPPTPPPPPPRGPGHRIAEGAGGHRPPGARRVPVRRFEAGRAPRHVYRIAPRCEAPPIRWRGLALDADQDRRGQALQQVAERPLHVAAVLGL